MSLLKAVRTGDTSLAASCSSGVVSELFRLKSTGVMRLSSDPACSMASMVLRKSGSAGSDTISSISFLAIEIAASTAGLKCSGLMRLKGAMPKGVGQSWRRGLSGVMGQRCGLDKYNCNCDLRFANYELRSSVLTHLRSLTAKNNATPCGMWHCCVV